MRRTSTIVGLWILLCLGTQAQYVSYWFQGWQRQGDAADAQAYFMRPGTNVIFSYATNRVYINVPTTVTSAPSPYSILATNAIFATNWTESNSLWILLSTNLPPICAGTNVVLTTNAGCLTINSSGGGGPATSISFTNVYDVAPGTNIVFYTNAGIVYIAVGTNYSPPALNTNFLFAWWQFEEGSGTNAFDSVDTWTGYLTNTYATNLNPTWTAGKIGNFAVSFDQSLNQFVAVPTMTTNYIQVPAGTFSWWQYQTQAWNSASTKGMWGWFGGMEWDCQVYYDGMSGANNTWYVGGGNTPETRLIFAANATNWPVNTWIHYAFTYGTNGQAFYTNGILCASNFQNSGTNVVLTAGEWFHIGELGKNASWFSGQIDDFRIYSTNLTAQQVYDLYQYYTTIMNSPQYVLKSGDTMSGPLINSSYIAADELHIGTNSVVLSFDPSASIVKWTQEGNELASFQSGQDVQIGYNNTAAGFGQTNWASNGGVAIGLNCFGLDAGVGIGMGAYGWDVASGIGSGVGIGPNAMGGYNGVSVGNASLAVSNGVAIGDTSSGSYHAVAIGTTATAAPFGVSIGYKSYGDLFSATPTLAIGSYAEAAAPYSIAIGVTNGSGTVDDQVAVDGGATGAVEIGSGMPATIPYALHYRGHEICDSNGVLVGTFAGDGTLITNLTIYPTNITWGGVWNMNGDIITGFDELNGNAGIFTNGLYGGQISGDGRSITNIASTNIVGVIPVSILPTNVAYLNSNQTFTGINYFTTAASNIFGTEISQTNSIANTFLNLDGHRSSAGNVIEYKTNNVSKFTVTTDGSLSVTGMIHKLEAGAANTIVVTNDRVGIRKSPSISGLDVSGALQTSSYIYSGSTISCAAAQFFNHDSRARYYSPSTNSLKWTDSGGSNPLMIYTNGILWASNLYAGVTVVATNSITSYAEVTATNFVTSVPKWIDIPMNYGYSTLGPSAPALTAVTNGSVIQELAFDNGDILYAQGQMQHNVATTNASFPSWYFEPHVHFTTIGTLDSTHSNVTWRIEWEFANINGGWAQGTNTATMGVTNNYTHYMLELGHITNNTLPHLSAIFRCRLMRPASATQDYSNAHDVLLDGFDLHIPVGYPNAIGSSSDNAP